MCPMLSDTPMTSDTSLPLWTHVPMWPMVWYIPSNSETGCSLWAHVSVCAHVPPCGQWFDTYLYSLRLCELMCQFVPMCSHVANVLIHTYNFRDWFAVLSSYDCMCPCTPMWLVVWYIAIDSETGYTLSTHVSLCGHVPVCVQWSDTRYNLWDKCSWWSYISLCSNNLQHLFYIVHSCVCICPCAPIWPMIDTHL